ncbi:MAG: hypothetical protein PHE12_01965, partial [Clostridia bacterium]|nr:hypothetical protein [Clostridia bacterium]
AYYGGSGGLLPIAAPQIPVGGKITDIFPLNRCAVILSKAKYKDCYYLPLSYDRAVIKAQGVSGAAKVVLQRKSFYNFGGKTAQITLKYN